MYYWLGSARENDNTYVYEYCRTSRDLTNHRFYTDGLNGVRPVITISKSLVSPVL